MKAVLVIDLPGDLDISLEDLKTEITLSSKDETKSLLYLKYDKVKLKPLPQKYNNGIEYNIRPHSNVHDYLEIGFKMGWDAYHDEITGETE